MSYRFLKTVLLIGIVSFTTAIYAEVPVIDETTEIGIPNSKQQSSSQSSQEEFVETSGISGSASSNSHLSQEQRLTRLEQQQMAMQNLALLNKINELQNQLQQQQGKIEVLQHDLQEAKDQQRKQYVDLDTRLSSTNSPRYTASVDINNNKNVKAKPKDTTASAETEKSSKKSLANKKILPLDPATPANFTGARD